MAQVNAGRVRFVSRGEYNNATQYYTFDLVNYNGSSYYAKQNTLGNLPTNVTYWQIVAEQGNGISSITKTSTSGLVDTYTITYTNGSTTTFNVNNGKGIVSITKILSQDNIDTYRITYNDGTTFEYQIENGSVTQTQFDELEDRVHDLERNQKTGEATGTEIDLTDAFDTRPRYLGIDATETKQQTTTGRNLLPIVPKSSLTDNGVTLTSNGDGSFSLSGTATADSSISFTLDNAVQLPDTAIYAHLRNGEIINGNLYLQSSNISVTSSPAFSSVNRIFNSPNLTNMILKYIGVLIKNGTNYDGFTFTPSLELTDNNTDYEPYTGGNPSPSPDYPQDVETMVGYRNEFDVGEDNDYNKYDTTISIANNAITGTIAASASGYIIKNTNYYINKFNYTLNYAGSSLGGRLLVRAYDSNGTKITSPVSGWTYNSAYGSYYHDGASSSFNLPSASYIKVGFVFIGTTGQNGIYSNIQITKGTEEKPYVPYGTNYIALKTTNGTDTLSYPISLGNQELLNKNDYVDKIIVDESTGESYIEKVWGKVVLDGSETWYTWTTTTTNTRGVYCYMSLTTVANGFCNYFPYSTTNPYTANDTLRFYFETSGQKYIAFRIPLMEVADWKEWLSTHNTEVYYVLAEPQLIPIDNPNIKLLNGVNHITNSEGAEMDIVYVKDINAYLDSINARIEALESANQGE